MTAPLSGYTTREVARMLGLSEPRIRSFVRAGFLTPGRGSGRGYRFSFEDLVILRAAQGLLEAGVAPERVKRSLARLARQLPDGRPLGSVRITAHGDQVAVTEGDDAWEPESGQRLFDFTVAELEQKSDRLAHRTVGTASEEDRQLRADDWYAAGVELEEDGEPEEAERAYRHALDLSPTQADAHLNLGRILHERGRLDLAESHYRQALDAESDESDEETAATAAFNLGVVLQDQDRPEDAVAAYRRAVELEPAMADAYFNLAGLYEQLGEQAVAIQSWKMYRALLGK